MKPIRRMARSPMLHRSRGLCSGNLLVKLDGSLITKLKYSQSHEGGVDERTLEIKVFQFAYVSRKQRQMLPGGLLRRSDGLPVNERSRQSGPIRLGCCAPDAIDEHARGLKTKPVRRLRHDGQGWRNCTRSVGP